MFSRVNENENMLNSFARVESDCVLLNKNHLVNQTV